MPLNGSAKTDLQGKKDAAATVQTTALARGDGPGAALAARQQKDALRMAEHNWDTLT